MRWGRRSRSQSQSRSRSLSLSFYLLSFSSLPLSSSLSSARLLSLFLLFRAAPAATSDKYGERKTKMNWEKSAHARMAEINRNWWRIIEYYYYYCYYWNPLNMQWLDCMRLLFASIVVAKFHLWLVFFSTSVWVAAATAVQCWLVSLVDFLNSIQLLQFGIRRQENRWKIPGFFLLLRRIRLLILVGARQQQRNGECCSMTSFLLSTVLCDGFHAGAFMVNFVPPRFSAFSEMAIFVCESRSLHRNFFFFFFFLFRFHSIINFRFRRRAFA